MEMRRENWISFEAARYQKMVGTVVKEIEVARAMGKYNDEETAELLLKLYEPIERSVGQIWKRKDGRSGGLKKGVFSCKSVINFGSVERPE